MKGRSAPSPPVVPAARRVQRFVLAGGAVLALVVGCGSEDARGPLPTPEDVPLQVVEGMVLRESTAGRPSWVLHADSALHYGAGERTRLLGVEIQFYNEAGDSIRSWLTAREGEMDPETHDLWARDSVVVRAEDGSVLETELLRWDQARGLVVSDCFVRITRGENVVTGVGIESDASLKSYRILSRVEAELHEGEDELEDR